MPKETDEREQAVLGRAGIPTKRAKIAEQEYSVLLAAFEREKFRKMRAVEERGEVIDLNEALKDDLDRATADNEALVELIVELEHTKRRFRKKCVCGEAWPCPTLPVKV